MKRLRAGIAISVVQGSAGDNTPNAATFHRNGGVAIVIGRTFVPIWEPPLKTTYQEIEEIWKLVPNGTAVEIRP